MPCFWRSGKSLRLQGGSSGELGQVVGGAVALAPIELGGRKIVYLRSSICFSCGIHALGVCGAVSAVGRGIAVDCGAIGRQFVLNRALVKLQEAGFEGVADMAAGGLVGVTGVAALDGGDDFGVFVDRLVGAALG